MSDHLLENRDFDAEVLREAIQEEYAEVAANPHKGFHFHTGRPLARMLEYADEWLIGIPEFSIESFAGPVTPSVWASCVPARGWLT
jgi:arsenite methyltransferase